MGADHRRKRKGRDRKEWISPVPPTDVARDNTESNPVDCRCQEEKEVESRVCERGEEPKLRRGNYVSGGETGMKGAPYRARYCVGVRRKKSLGKRKGESG